METFGLFFFFFFRATTGLWCDPTNMHFKFTMQSTEKVVIHIYCIEKLLDHDQSITYVH